MLVNSYGFQNYPNMRNQASFGQAEKLKTEFDHFCTLPAEEVKSIVENLTKRVEKHPYNQSLQARLRDAKAALEKLAGKK